MSEPDHVASTREVYDHSASRYVELVGTRIDPAFETTDDRALLDTFADDVLAQGGGSVLDIGCGPGRVTRFLAERGLEIAGVDLSAQMVAAARKAHPDLRFDVGALTDLPVADSALAGVVLWYSIIHTPPTELNAVWRELARVAAPGALVDVAFQAGQNDQVDRPDAYGSSETLTLYRHSIDDVARTLDRNGFEITGRTLREAELPHETTPQAFLSARRRPT